MKNLKEARKEIRSLKKAMSDARIEHWKKEGDLKFQIERKNKLLRELLKWLCETENPNRIYGVNLISKEVLP
jgi:hypothetical protein